MVRLVSVLALFGLLVFAGCGKEHCEKLLQVACDHVAEDEDGIARCEALTRQAETVDDEQCEEILQLLTESGKLQDLQ